MKSYSSHDCNQDTVETLILYGSTIQNLSITHAGLKSLDFLSFENGSTRFPRLEILNVSQNHISSIPLRFPTTLKDLDVSNNDMEHFRLAHETRLEKLNISNNQFGNYSTLPNWHNLPNLKVFRCSNNRINHFPVGFNVYQSFFEINLSHNQIHSLEGIWLPETVFLLKLNSNNIEFNEKSIPVPSFVGMIHLDLSNNLISNFNSMLPHVFRTLQYLDLSNNKLVAFNMKYGHAINLVSLNLSNNHLSPEAISNFKTGMIESLRCFYIMGQRGLENKDVKRHFLNELALAFMNPLCEITEDDIPFSRRARVEFSNRRFLNGLVVVTSMPEKEDYSSMDEED